MAMLAALLIAVTAGCDREDKEAEGIRVVTTVPPLAGFIERLGGERVSVTVMVPPGANPHTFEPRPSQLKEVSRAVLFVKVGSGMDFELAWMDKLLAMNRTMFVVDSSIGVELLESQGKDHGDGPNDEDEDEDRHEAGDPHIWLSPKNAAIMAENIFEGLKEIDPEGSDYYAGRMGAFLTELEELDAKIRESLSGHSGEKVLVYHPAWSYFTAEYGLVQVPIEVEGKEATPRGLRSLIEQARREGIKTVFASPEFSTRAAEVVAKEIGGTVVLISPLEKDYAANMLRVARAFSEGRN